eukprot:1266831-Prymnesium_polylepis.1
MSESVALAGARVRRCAAMRQRRVSRDFGGGGGAGGSPGRDTPREAAGMCDSRCAYATRRRRDPAPGDGTRQSIEWQCEWCVWEWPGPR